LERKKKHGIEKDKKSYKRTKSVQKTRNYNKYIYRLLMNLTKRKKESLKIKIYGQDDGKQGFGRE